MKKEKRFPHFRGFKATMLKKDRKAGNIEIVVAYVFMMICLGLFGGALLLAVGMLKASSQQKEQYPGNKYRKVIKKGLIYDNIEYHER